MTTGKRRIIEFPSSAQARDGVLLSLTNARRHLKGADILADERLYGLAVSHLVLSMEELTKSWAYTLIAIDAGLPEREMRNLLLHHGARHAAALGDFFVIVHQFIAVTVTRRLAREARRIGFEKARAKYVPALVEELKRMAAGTHRNNPALAVFHWINHANDRKNAGFYVDFSDQSFHHPGTFRDKDYLFGRELVGAYLRTRTRSIKAILASGYTCDDEARALLRSWNGRIIDAGSPQEMVSTLLTLAFNGLKQQ